MIGEYNNPLTMKEFSFLEKLEASFFQSINVRTAGFATLPQENLTNASALVSMALMLIGGSPAGTAGGIKTVTLAILVVTMIAMVKDKQEVTLFNRKIAHNDVRKAIAVTLTTVGIIFISTFSLALITDAPLLDIMYETTSAATTVGVSRNLTTSLNALGKCIIIATMYFGRVGPISLALALNTKKRKTNIIKHPVEEITIG